MNKQKLREEILEQIYGDYADQEGIPNHRMTQDWFLRYKSLSKMIVEYLNTP